MMFKWVVARSAKGATYLKQSQTGGSSQTKKVFTVSAALQTLGRSRRQIYRYLREGTLVPLGKFLGEWLVEARGVESLACFKEPLRALPRNFEPLFPEYSLKDLNLYRDWRLISARILELGDRKQLHWLLKRYPKTLIIKMIKEDGWRLLSLKTIRLWCLYFNMKLPQPASWRAQGRRWGGAA